MCESRSSRRKMNTTATPRASQVKFNWRPVHFNSGLLKCNPLFVSFYSRSIKLCSFTSLDMSRSQQARESSVITGYRTLTHARLHGIPIPLHIQNIAFRHLPPNSARTGSATEGAALFISAQLSTGVVNALPKVWVLIWLWKQHSIPTRGASAPGKKRKKEKTVVPIQTILVLFVLA